MGERNRDDPPGMMVRNVAEKASHRTLMIATPVVMMPGSRFANGLGR
jgi:hypothetical protein